MFILQRSEGGTDFDDFVLRPVVDIWVVRAYVIEDIQHHRPVSRAHLVDYKIVVGIET